MLKYTLYDVSYDMMFPFVWARCGPSEPRLERKTQATVSFQRTPAGKPRLNVPLWRVVLRVCLTLLAAQVPPVDPDASAGEPPAMADEARNKVLRAISAMDALTNFSAAVDVDIVHRKAPASPPTRGKEAWKYSRVGRTNYFVRTRFTSIPGVEAIESSGYSGGQLQAGDSSTSLPKEASLPGFEAANLLSEMLLAGPAIESRDTNVCVIVATFPTGDRGKVWFYHARTMPFRLEKHRGSSLLFVLNRTEASDGRQFLPISDALHIYENGSPTLSILRSFLSAVELSTNPPPAGVSRR